MGDLVWLLYKLQMTDALMEIHDNKDDWLEFKLFMEKWNAKE